VPYLGPKALLECAPGKKITTVEFASFGNPSGSCGQYILGTCNAIATKQIVDQECLGKETCSIALNRAIFNQNGADPCPEILVKTLAIQVRCY